MRKRVRTSLRAAVVTVLAGFLMPASAQAQVEAQPEAQPEAQVEAQAEAPAPETVEPRGPNPAAAAFDVLIVRPFGLAALPVGVAAFIPAALLTAPNGMDSIRQALDLFVISPANYVFRRPLGEF